MEWIAQNEFRFHGERVETWKSKTGEWAFGHGTEIGDHLLLETLVTGFSTEADATAAALRHCYEGAVESACCQGHEDDFHNA